MKIAFFVEDGFFTNFFDDIFTALRAKLKLIDDISNLIESIINVSFNDQLPENLKVNFFGEDYDIVDFSFFTQFRMIVFAFVKYPLWFFMLKKMYESIPYLVE